MKKRMKKAVTAIISLAVIISMLSGCGKENTKPSTEEPTNKPTEVVTTVKPTDVDPTVEPTQEPTTEPTVTAEPTTEPVGNKIVPLFMDRRTDEVKNASAEDFFIYENLIYFFAPVIQLNDKAYNDNLLNRFEGAPYSFVVRPQNPEATERTTIDFYFYTDRTSTVYTYYETDAGKSGTVTFVPLFYDQADQSLIGFYSNAGPYKFVKLYYNPISGVIMTTEVDRADYY